MKASKILKILALAVAVFAMPQVADAQRKVTPVEPVPSMPGVPSKKPEKKVADRTNVVERKDAHGNVVLVDTISGKEWVDSTEVKQVKVMEYPLWHAVDIGVNVWDPVMRALGQKYGLIDFYGELSLHNRYKPIVEIGLGMMDEVPDGMNFRYKSKLAPYFKVGMNYNVFYNSNPDYQLLVGARVGYSSFSYEIVDATIDQGYWGDQAHFSIPSQSTSATWMELCAGVKVKIAKPISLGWLLRYHSLMSEGKPEAGEPMYIPGFGKRKNSLTLSFSIIYTLPLNKSKSPSVKAEGGDGV